METGRVWGLGLEPSSPWGRLCVSPVSHPPPLLEERSEEVEVELGAAGGAAGPPVWWPREVHNVPR